MRANVGMADALYSAHFCKEKENKLIQMNYAYLLVFNAKKLHQIYLDNNNENISAHQMREKKSE